MEPPLNPTATYQYATDLHNPHNIVKLIFESGNTVRERSTQAFTLTCRQAPSGRFPCHPEPGRSFGRRGRHSSAEEAGREPWCGCGNGRFIADKGQAREPDPSGKERRRPLRERRRVSLQHARVPPGRLVHPRLPGITPPPLSHAILSNGP